MKCVAKNLCLLLILLCLPAVLLASHNSQKPRVLKRQKDTVINIAEHIYNQAIIHSLERYIRKQKAYEDEQKTTIKSAQERLYQASIEAATTRLAQQTTINSLQPPLATSLHMRFLPADNLTQPPGGPLLSSQEEHS